MYILHGFEISTHGAGTGQDRGELHHLPTEPNKRFGPMFAVCPPTPLIYRINAELKVFYRLAKIEDRIELSMKAIGAEKTNVFPHLSGPGIKGATASIESCVCSLRLRIDFQV
jgi:hypothetical protein